MKLQQPGSSSTGGPARSKSSEPQRRLHHMYGKGQRQQQKNQLLPFPPAEYSKI